MKCCGSQFSWFFLVRFIFFASANILSFYIVLVCKSICNDYNFLYEAVVSNGSTIVHLQRKHFNLHFIPGMHATL